MTRRTYAQYCGLSRAVEIIGERWSMLIVRDLLVSARTAGRLRAGLPRITPEVLDARLRELAAAGVVRRRAAGVWELTGYGRALEGVVLRLARWGARLPAEPEEVLTEGAAITALRAAFRPHTARGEPTGYQINAGDVVVNARVAGGVLRTGTGPLPGAGVIAAPGTALIDLLRGDPAEARVEAADPVLLERFTRHFRLP